MKLALVIFVTVAGFLAAYLNAKEELRKMEDTQQIPISPAFYGMVGGVLGFIISVFLVLSYSG